ncbi:anti-virulence regulator CigR family protein [Vogesella oryzae]|uniref:anti-virulence regulator CigR family protein n=1 Tax=Vogesella oryzae TaxID=1735285 RepID=UPI001581E2DD|nr:anti-virulence regulator CigR family protein [Vogesella oryzae]
MKRDWHTKTLLAAISLSLVGMPVMAAPPEGKGNGNHQDGYQHQGETPPWMQGQKHDKHEKYSKGGKSAHHDAGSRHYESAGISRDDARRFAYESHLNYGEYRSLPPGIRKNLARGKPLPPGIAKRYVPHDMLVRLPERPGYEWRVVGTDLVLVTVGTLIVHEILKDVFMH